MSYSLLFDTIVNISMFLELSEENVIDPDAAVSQMEDIMHTLTSMDLETKRLLLDHVNKKLDIEAAKEANSEKIEFLSSFGSNFGLVEQ